MILETPSEPKFVDEYDIATESGLVMPVTIDTKQGDSFIETEDKIVIYLTPRGSIHDSGHKLPAENITIYKRHVISVNHRIREILPLNPEQQFQWQKTIQEMTSTQVH